MAEAGKIDWEVDNMGQLRRLISTGSEHGIYLAEERNMTRDDTTCVFRLMEDGKGPDIVQEIVKFVTGKKATKEKAIIFVLALCAKASTDLKTRQAAFKAVPDVCQTPSQLFSFIELTRKLSEKTCGWGRAQRNAVKNWYNKQTPNELASCVTKFRQKNGWSHVDLLRLAHVKPETEAIGFLLKYVSKGLAEGQKEFDNDKASDDLKAIMKYVAAVEKLKHSHDEHEAAMTIEEHHLEREHIPTWMVKSKEVWRALLQHMSLRTTLKNLGKLSAVGLLDPSAPDSCSSSVLDRLKDYDLLKQEKIDPFYVLLTLKTYERGKAEKGKLTWNPFRTISDALYGTFYASLKNVEGTGKRYLMAVDVSGSMSYGGVKGCPQLSPAVAASAMALQTAHSEKDYTMVAFSKQIKQVKLEPGMSIQALCETIAGMPMGETDVSAAILWALHEKKPVDVFIMFTDCDTYTGQTLPAEALRKYRKEMDLPHARLIVCALTSSGFSMADPNDSGMLDVAGFDGNAPSALRSFIMGEL